MPSVADAPVLCVRLPGPAHAQPCWETTSGTEISCVASHEYGLKGTCRTCFVIASPFGPMRMLPKTRSPGSEKEGRWSTIGEVILLSSLSWKGRPTAQTAIVYVPHQLGVSRK